MISDKSLHISTLKNVIVWILQAKMYSVIFCLQTKKVSIVEGQNFHVRIFYVKIFMWVYSTYFPFE